MILFSQTLKEKPSSLNSHHRNSAAPTKARSISIFSCIIAAATPQHPLASPFLHRSFSPYSCPLASSPIPHLVPTSHLHPIPPPTLDVSIAVPSRRAPYISRPGPPPISNAPQLFPRVPLHQTPPSPLCLTYRHASYYSDLSKRRLSCKTPLNQRIRLISTIGFFVNVMFNYACCFFSQNKTAQC